MKKLSLIFALLIFGLCFTSCSENSTNSPESLSGDAVQKARASFTKLNTFNSLEETATCKTLYAGQTINAGNVCFEVVDGNFCVTYTTTDGWELDEYHLWVGTDIADMPQTKKGSPKLGHFPFKATGLSGGSSPVTSVTVCLSAGDIVEGADDLCALGDLVVVAHAVVKKDTDGDGILDADETAYGDGFDLGNSWAMGMNVPLCEVEVFDTESFEQDIEDLAGTNNLVKLNVTHQGGNSAQPYFRGKLDFDEDGSADLTNLPFYCVDLAHTIYSNRWYCALMLSTYDESIPSEINHPENLDLVNYILNNYQPGEDGYTGGDIQRALWELVYGTRPNPGAYASGPSTNANVDAIIADAVANGENYTPPCDGVVGVILYPVPCTGDGIAAQVLIAQALVTEFPTTCGTVCTTVCE